jgi:hypothetical protein
MKAGSVDADLANPALNKARRQLVGISRAEFEKSELFCPIPGKQVRDWLKYSRSHRAFSLTTMKQKAY